MAATACRSSVARGFSKIVFKDIFCLAQIQTRHLAFFGRKIKPVDDSDFPITTRKHNNKLDGPLTQEVVSSLKERSSLRTRPAYNPPVDAESRVRDAVCSLCGEAHINELDQVSLHDPAVKFKLLSHLIREFQHDIPNSDLDTMKTAHDLLTYFTTPVKDTTSYEDLKHLELPKNLHIQMDPVRFDPQTDTFFDGLTAFPGRPTIVTSLKYKNKYRSVNVDETLPQGYIPRKGNE